MKLDPRKPPPWKTPGFFPLMMLMMLASGLMIVRGGRGGGYERSEKPSGLGDVPFRPSRASSAAPSASASAAPSASSSAGQ